MKKLSASFLAILLACQLILSSVAGAFTSSFNDVHQSFAHSQDLDHHHHDAFSMHDVDHHGETAHQHFTDSFQSVAIIHLSPTQDISVDGPIMASATQLAPPDIFLEGPLRPPQTRL